MSKFLLTPYSETRAQEAWRFLRYFLYLAAPVAAVLWLMS